MRHLKAADPQHTVIMVQVRTNRALTEPRGDYSPTAEKMFQGGAGSVAAQVQQAPGNWTQVFGADAEEFFHAWSVAHYIGQVAAAGKAEYPLPMYVNAALRDPFNPGKPGGYASGGPTDNVLEIYRAAAPAIDMLAPDIYMRESAKANRVLELYARPDNPLLRRRDRQRRAYAAISSRRSASMGSASCLSASTTPAT